MVLVQEIPTDEVHRRDSAGWCVGQQEAASANVVRVEDEFEAHSTTAGVRKGDSLLTHTRQKR